MKGREEIPQRKGADMGYEYRGGKNSRTERLAKLRDYSEALKRIPAPKKGGLIGGAKIRANLRAAKAADRFRISRGPLDPSDWEMYADNPECWGGQFGLWLAAQEIADWEALKRGDPRTTSRRNKLRAYSTAVKRKGTPKKRTPKPEERADVAEAARIRANLRAAAAAEVNTILRSEVRSDWEKYADDPERWGGEFGLWLATQEAAEHRFR